MLGWNAGCGNPVTSKSLMTKALTIYQNEHQGYIANQTPDEWNQPHTGTKTEEMAPTFQWTKGTDLIVGETPRKDTKPNSRTNPPKPNLGRNVPTSHRDDRHRPCRRDEIP